MIASVRGVSAGYDSSLVLRDLSLEFEAGQTFCLLGRNGAGKSTFVKSLLGLIPRDGSVTLVDSCVDGLPPHAIARLGVGYAPQEAAVFRELTVRENLVLAARSRGLPARAIASAVAPFPILSERMAQRAGTLSGGEQKMLILARALLGPPRLAILDEVSEGVQPTVLDTFAEVISEVAAEHGVTFLLAEQHIAFGLSAASRFAVMESGEIVEAGAVDDDTPARVQRHLTL